MGLLLKCCSHFSLVLVFFFVPFSLAQQKSMTAGQTSDMHFEKKKVKIKNKIILVEIAETESQQERGLMYRTKMPQDEGMLFIFPRERILSFWMKNTYIDLSIGYFDKNKKLIDIQEMQSTSPIMLGSPKTYPSSGPAKYALEMNRGWFKKNKINVGDSLMFIEEKTTSSKK